jgi:putative transcriptional regulator
MTKNKKPSTVKVNLAALMDKRGIMIKDLAAQTGLNVKTISDLRKNSYDRIGLDTIAKLCDALGVGVADLLVLSPQD